MKWEVKAGWNFSGSLTRRVIGLDATGDQHPPAEKPSITVIFAEPPSVVGIAGGQMVEGALGAVAVVLADCVDVSGLSPGNCSGT
jgi:hypothetical protein